LVQARRYSIAIFTTRTQVCEREPARGLAIAVLDPAHRELVLFLARDRRVLAQLRHVGGERIRRPDLAIRARSGDRQARGRDGATVSRVFGHRRLRT
jgi:hypothetical protein